MHHLSKLEANVSGSEDEQTGRNGVQLLNAVTRQKRDVGQARNIRNRWASTCVNEDTFGGQVTDQTVVLHHFDLLRPEKTTGAQDEVEARKRGEVLVVQCAHL